LAQDNMIVCAISNTEPDTPVITPQGVIFEKRLIEKHLEQNDTCPVTDKPLSVKDLTELRSSAFTKSEPPRPQSLTNLISLFQNEWDALMFENYSLQEQVTTLQKELSQNLYNHEAAARVIFKLQEEVKRANEENQLLRRQLTEFGPSSDVKMDDAEEKGELGITSELDTLFRTTSDELLKMRKGMARKPLPDLFDKDQIKKFTCKSSNPVHATTAPGIKCVDVLGNKIVTGGNDSCLVLFNKQKGKVVAKMSGHQKPILDVRINRAGVIISGSADSTARLWKTVDETNYSCASVVRCHNKDVTSISCHPAGDHYITASLDKSFALHDLKVARTVVHAKSSDSKFGEFTAMKIHPDGMIVCGGTKSGECSGWDILTQKSVALNIPTCEGPVTSLNFSENGYYMIVANQVGEGGVVKLWDLRKTACLQTLEFDDIPTCSRFDDAGKYLGICAGNIVSVYNFPTSKTLGEVVKLQGHEKSVQSMAFLPNAESVVSVSLDRMVKIWGL